MSQFNQIETFITVVELNSFAKAAKKLGISAAAISKQISVLERHLKVQLLLRTTRQLQLTEFGSAYYEQCKRILAEMQEANSLIAQMQNEPEGLLRVMATPYYGEHFILPYLAEFSALYPKVILDIELIERIPNMLREQIDLLFGFSVDPSPELVRRKIGEARFIICATPGYLTKYGVPRTPSDLTGHRYIAHSRRPEINIIQLKNQLAVKMKPTLLLNSNEAIRVSTLNSLGITQLHDFVVKDDLKRGKLKEILKDYAEPRHPIYLYYQPSRYLQPKIRKFIDFILEKMKIKN